MLSGNFYLIKNLIDTNKYENIYLVGISGGGWYATFMAALIPEIEKSYSFAGTIPKMLRIFKDNRGDWEQIESEIYKEIDYWNLYKLSTLDENYNQNRFHYQIYNKNDPCCFMRPYSKVMKYVSDKINYKKFKYLIIKSLETKSFKKKSSNIIRTFLVFTLFFKQCFNLKDQLILLTLTVLKELECLITLQKFFFS